MNLRPNWQFWRMTHPPDYIQALMAFLAGSSWPYPIDTFSVVFFFFLAKSSIALVGSAPGESKKRTGTLYLDSAQISCIGYEIGSINYWPRIAAINFELATRVLSSLTLLTKNIYINALISYFYWLILSARSGIG